MRDNRSPVQDATVATQFATGVVGGVVDIDLSLYFSDPDSDMLAYTAVSSDPAKATAVINGSTLTLTHVATGLVDITVTASDDFDSVQQTFQVQTNRTPRTTVSGFRQLRPKMTGFRRTSLVTSVTRTTIR